MYPRLFILLPFFLIWNFSVKAQTLPQHYAHVPANAGTNNLFFNQSVCEKFQFIYTQSEIANMVTPVTGPITIDTIWFRFGGGSGLTSTQLSNLQVRMGHTTLTNPGVQFNTNFNAGPAQTVISSTNYTLTPLVGAANVPANNWTFIVLQTPFSYNFTDNLCIEFSFSASSGNIIGNYANNGGAPVCQYAGTSSATNAQTTTSRPMFGISSNQNNSGQFNCDPNGNWVLFANYDGGNLNIVVDQNVPNLKIGICTYEPVNVNFSGPFVGNVTQVLYAGFNSAQNNNNCGFPIATSSFSGINPALVSVNVYPPVTVISPPNPNNFLNQPNGWNGGIVCLYNCNLNIDQGGCNTADQVLAYFQTQFGGVLRGLNVQYPCWLAGTQYTISGQTGNCCGICNPDVVNLNETICQNQLPYAWNGLTFNGSGSQTVTLTNAGGCDSLVTLNLNVVQQLTSLTNLTVCSNQLPYSWNGQIINASGTYTATLNSAAGCDSIATLNLTVANAVSSSDAIVACETYTWIDGITYTSSTNTPQFTIAGGAANGCDSIVTLNLTINQNASATMDIEACGSYLAENGQTYTQSNTFSYTIPSQNGCDSTITVNLTIFDEPLVSINPPGVTQIDLGNSIQLSASGALNYIWSPASSLNCSNCSSPLANPQTTTTYTVTGTDANGCTGTAQATISLEIDCNEIFVPTVFSPNGAVDEENRQVCVYGNCIVSLNYAVFNRWGEKVFETSDLSNCWDGTYKGMPLNSGVYSFLLNVSLLNGEVVTQSGNVTLIR
jgi:gliding motility-associated-like protein